MGDIWTGPSVAISSAGTLLTTISGIFPGFDFGSFAAGSSPAWASDSDFAARSRASPGGFPVTSQRPVISFALYQMSPPLR